MFDYPEVWHRIILIRVLVRREGQDDLEFPLLCFLLYMYIVAIIGGER